MSPLERGFWGGEGEREDDWEECEGVSWGEFCEELDEGCGDGFGEGSGRVSGFASSSAGLGEALVDFLAMF